MLKYLAFLGVLLASFAAHGQSKEDPTISSYRQLLTEANDRVAAMNGAIIRQAEEIRVLRAELDKLKEEKAAKAVPK
jgi:hypothetical protein